MTEIYIVRHAEAEGNTNRMFQGSVDTNISENGEKQLERLMKRALDFDVDKIYSSPLKRAQKTAEAFRAGRDIPIVTEAGLSEIMCGDWEGKSWDVIESDYPVEHNLWRNAPEKFSAPNGESMERVYNRIREAIDGIARENDGKRVAVVSHGCALRNYMCHARFGDIKRLRDADWIEHTSITCVRYYERSIEVVFANDFAHLDESLTTLKKAPYRNLSETVKTK